MRLFHNGMAFAPALVLWFPFPVSSELYPSLPSQTTHNMSNDLPETSQRHSATLRGHAKARLDLTVFNNQSSLLYAHITALEDRTNDLMMLIDDGGGAFSWSVKPTGTSSIPNMYTADNTTYEIELHPKQNTTFYLPSYVHSGRVYIAKQPLCFGTTIGGPNQGFVQPSVSNPSLREYNIPFQFLEFTYLPGNFIADISNMDFISIPLGMTVVSKAGNSTTVPGLGAKALDSVCSALQQQASIDGYSWDKLCIYDDQSNLIRVISPNQYLAIHPSDTLSRYYDPYLERVWSHYSSTDLIINTQDSNGIRSATGRLVYCRVNEDEELGCYEQANTCGRPDYLFSKPNSVQIFGCTQDIGSPFAVTGNKTQAEIVPRFCAAFHRSTLLLDGGHIQPNINITADQYYTENITNHYARIVHQYEERGMGYAFAYDDTSPVGPALTNATANAAGVINDPSPRLLYIMIGN